MTFRAARIAVCALLVCMVALAEDPLPEANDSGIGYPNVEAALKALKAKPGVQIKEQQGWTIITDSENGNPVLWSFAPQSDPAYPSAVKRSLVSEAGGSFINMQVHCEAKKAPCDNLVRQFQALNDKLIQEVKGSSARPASKQSSTGAEALNVTSDSAPGWLPSPEQRAQVPVVTHAFLDALDKGDYKKAYDLMADLQQRAVPFAGFEHESAQFNRVAGAVRLRNIIKVTWTKDPLHASIPGIYAAVDLVSRFENVDRHCGYIMLYQPDAATPFRVMRTETTYMTNEAAHDIAAKQSVVAVDQAWAKAQAHCPK